MHKKHVKERIVVPKIPYFAWLKQVDVLDQATYGRELRELSKKRYSVVNFDAAVDLDENGTLRLPDKVRVVYIVDIDAPFVHTALEMARANRSHGLACTFNPRLYHFENDELNAMIRRISRMRGQEIGYQYEELADCRANVRKARAAFRGNVKYLRAMYPITTLMAHGRTGEGYRTADLFKSRDGRYQPRLWQKQAFRRKADFYYFLTAYNGVIHYFNESTRSPGREYVETLRGFNRGDVVVMLHHSEYLCRKASGRRARSVR